jgi:arylsulfatase A-like enzyme
MTFHVRSLVLLLLVGTLTACAAPGEDSRPNVIVISIDTLRADHTGWHGYDRETTPHLDDFATTAISFDRAYTPASHTLPAHVSLFTSLYPDTHGVIRMKDALSPSVETLAGILSERGYETAAFLNAGWLHPKFGLDRGFETYDFYHDLKVERLLGIPRFGRNAEQTNEAVFEWLDRTPSSPFLLFVHYFDVHSDWERLPYDAPPPYGTMFVEDYDGEFTGGEGGVHASKYLLKMNEEDIRLSNADRDYVKGLYDGGIAYTDAQFQRLLAKLDSMDLLENSIVIVTSDHGEEFQEHGMVLHEQVYEELIHVPLIVRLPTAQDPPSVVTEPRRLENPVQLVDVMPTVLDYLGIELPGASQGRSLWPVIEGSESSGRRIYARNIDATQYAIVEGNWKLVYEPESRATRLFDLTADPAETQERNDDEKTAELLTNLLEWIETAREMGQVVRSETVEIDEDTREALKALGYIE